MFTIIVSLGGLLRPVPPASEYSVAGCVGACFAAAIASVNIRALIYGLDNEAEGAKIARQDLNLNAFIGLAIGWVIAQNNPDEWGDYVSGSFGFLWTTVAVVLAIGYLIIIAINYSSSGRKEMGEHLFKEEVDSIEGLNAFLFVFYGITWFLTATLQLGIMRDFMPAFMTMFGILGPKLEPFKCDLETLIGGAWALGVGMLNVYAFTGSHENSDLGNIRRFSAVVFWTSTVITFTRYPNGGSFAMFWSVVAAVLGVMILKRNTVVRPGGYVHVQC